MLVNDVITSESVALAAENAAQNDIPYLGLGFFPENKKSGLDLKWIKTHRGLSVTLAPSNFDALPAIRAREGLKVERSQMAFFRESMLIKEEDVQEIARIADENDPYLQSALLSVYDDTTTLVRGAEVVAERMRMQLLAAEGGTPRIGIESGGVKYEYNYDPSGDYAANHYLELQGDSTWNSSGATPISDLIAAKKALEKIGRSPRYALMNSTTFSYLLDNDQVRNAIVLQGLLNADLILDDATVIGVIERKTGLSILIYDKMYIDDDGVEQLYYPDNKVTLLPEGTVGGTWYGTTPEERTAGQADVDVSLYGVGIAIAVKTDYGPPALTSTTASEIVLPSYEGMDSTYVIKVASDD